MTDDARQPAPDLRSAAVEGLRWTAITRPAIEIVFLCAMVVLARIIPPAEFGRFAIAAIAQELAFIIVSVGVGTVLVQLPAITKEHLQSGVALALITSVGLMLLTLVAATVIVVPLFGERTADLVRLSSPMYLLSGASTVPMALLRRRLAFRRLSVIDLAASASRSVASVALAVAGLGGAALVLGGLAAGFVTMVIAWISAPQPWPRLFRGPVRDIRKFGLPTALASVSWVGFRNCDYAIVGARLGALQAGYYFRAYTLAIDYQKKLSLVIGQIGFPMLARAGSAGQRSAMRGQMVRLLTVVLFPMLAVLAVVAPVLVPWLFGSAWTPAVTPTQLLVLGGASTLVIDVVGAELMAGGRGRALLGYGVAHFAAYAGAVVLVAPLGLAAVAGAATVVHTLFLFVAYELMLWGTDERPMQALFREIAPATASCVGMLAAAIPVSRAMTETATPTVVQLTVVTLVATVAYLLTLWLFFGGAWRELWSLARAVIPGTGRRGPAPRAVPETPSAV